MNKITELKLRKYAENVGIIQHLERKNIDDEVYYRVVFLSGWKSFWETPEYTFRTIKKIKEEMYDV